MRRATTLLTCLLACSSSSGSPSGAGGDAGASADTSPDVPVGNVVEHGTIVDYFTLKPVAGLTVSDNGVTTTTDANGVWSLTAPKSSTLQLTVTGPKYTKLLFPDEVASGDDANSSIVVMADSSSYNLEQNSLTGFDAAKALVQLVLVTIGTSCTSVVGGTLKVVAPAGVSVTYFDGTTGIPQDALTTFQNVKPNRPVAVMYNIPVGADLTVQVGHPTCKQVPFPATGEHGITLTGKVRTVAAEPGDGNSALVVLMQ